MNSSATRTFHTIRTGLAATVAALCLTSLVASGRADAAVQAQPNLHRGHHVRHTPAPHSCRVAPRSYRCLENLV